MKKLLKIVIGIVVVFILGIVAIFYFTAGMADAADAFFAAIKSQDIATARSYLSEDFKASTDEIALKEFLSKGALLKFKEASWSNRQISGGRGELNGEVTTDTGGVIPLKLLFVKENDAWKIYAIQKPTAGLQTEETSPTIPSKADQVVLVKQSIHDFLVSKDKKDMEHFRETISRLWQKQVTTEKLNEAFKPIIDSEADWSVLENFDPTFSSEATVNENGVLILAGHYPTKPNQVTFEQKFIYEGVAWKLVGFSLYAK